jgi:hypothetical protein
VKNLIYLLPVLPLTIFARFKNEWYQLLQLLRQRIEQIEVDNYKFAKFCCQIVPASCPFAREIRLGDRSVLRIPPLCKLNPFYEQIVSLRFKSLSYLADVCGEDITIYC